MITRLLHRVVAQPKVYDLAQILAGAKAVRRRLAAQVAAAQQGLAAPFVLDIGGGTGAVGEWLSPDARYCCLDIDPQKLVGFLSRYPRGVGIQGDASRIPLADAAVDLALCNSVTHHLTDPQLAGMVAEAARVLKPNGRLILTDAIWKPTRWPGRLLWHYDRGSFPRPPEILRDVISRHLRVDHWQHFRVWHEYVISVATRRA
jgi:ubiquinone/menaquinone biosynthesis C-methylase UbiE